MKLIDEHNVENTKKLLFAVTVDQKIEINNTFTLTKWKDVVGYLNKSQLHCLMVINVNKFKNFVSGFSITFEYSFDQEYYYIPKLTARDICFGINSDLINAFIVKKYQEMFFEGAKRFKAITGYISLEVSRPGASPNTSTYENMLDLKYHEHSPKFDEFVRGYYWGNIISKKHIEKLGGVSSVIKYSPGIVKKLSENMFYLQLADDVFNFTYEQLRELKSFFKPVLKEEQSISKIKYEMYIKKNPYYARLIFD
ncbi:hypothetical protein CHISP_2570 [Chitinispirillum alkaliphilum]|nr:hypothetical protein CHISP_2570 [Chitinispirillum alkaliphilum]